MKLLSRQDIESKIPQLKNLSFIYWALVAQVKPFKKRMIKNRRTFFYTPYAARKIESVLRKHKPSLFNGDAQ